MDPLSKPNQRIKEMLEDLRVRFRTGLSWLSIERIGLFLWMLWWSFGNCKSRESVGELCNCWLSKKNPASCSYLLYAGQCD